MDRDELIKAAERHRDNYDWQSTKSIDIAEMGYEWAADFALSVSGWTAVNEKLPEIKGKYLVTLLHEHAPILETETAWWNGEEFRCERTSGRVIAYIPYPAPYKPQEAKI